MHRVLFSLFPLSLVRFAISLICGFFPAPVTPNGHFFFFFTPGPEKAAHYAWKTT